METTENKINDAFRELSRGNSIYLIFSNRRRYLGCISIQKCESKIISYVTITNGERAFSVDDTDIDGVINCFDFLERKGTGSMTNLYHILYNKFLDSNSLNDNLGIDNKTRIELVKIY